MIPYFRVYNEGDRISQEVSDYFTDVFYPSFLNGEPIEVTFDSGGYVKLCAVTLKETKCGEERFDLLVKLIDKYPDYSYGIPHILFSLYGYNIDVLKKARKKDEVLPDFLWGFGSNGCERFGIDVTNIDGVDASFVSTKYNSKTNNYVRIYELYKKLENEIFVEDNKSSDIVHKFIQSIVDENSGWYGARENATWVVKNYIFRLCENEIRLIDGVRRLPKPNLGNATRHFKSEETKNAFLFIENEIKSLLQKYLPHKKEESSSKKIIYVYKHIDVISHIGWLKIGETTKNYDRIVKQNEASNVQCEIVYTTDAKINDGSELSDKDIHTALEQLGYEREMKHNMWGKATNKKSEWFKISEDEVKSIIEGIKMVGLHNFVRDNRHRA